MSFLRGISTLERGDHACLIYDDPDRRDELMLAFLETGLLAGERVVYVDEHADARIVRELTERAQSGQFEALVAADAYLADGEFEPDRVLTSLRAVRDESLAAGFHGLRAGGSPPESLRCNGRSHLLAEYERRANELFEDGAMVAICAYDTRTTDPKALFGIVDAHPLVFFAVGSHARLRIDTAAPDRIALHGWLDLTTLGSLVGSLSNAVASADRVSLDLKEVDFIDVAGLRLLVEAADTLRERGGVLTLRSAPKWMPRVLTILGYGDRDGLVLL